MPILYIARGRKHNLRSRRSLARLSIGKSIVVGVGRKNAGVEAKIVVASIVVAATSVVVVAALLAAVVAALLTTVVVVVAAVAAVATTEATATTELPGAQGLALGPSIDDGAVRGNEGVSDGDEADETEKDRLGEHVDG